MSLATIVYLMGYRLGQFLPSLIFSEDASSSASNEFTGTIAPSQEFKIAAATPAIVKDIHVKIGDRIQPHQPLVTYSRRSC